MQQNNNKNPFFSVVIPLYNKAFSIKETLQSVLEQSFTNFEIIIINDGSTDNSLSIVEQFNDERITITSQINSGVSSARNKGIELSKAEYIAFIDADDFWHPNHLETISNLIIDFPDCGMYCSRYKIKISNNRFIKNNLKYTLKDSYRGIVSDFFKSSLKYRVALTSAVAIKKEIVEKIGQFNENLIITEDLEYWIKIALQFPVAITNQVTCIYYFEEHNISKINIANLELLNLKEFKSYEKNNTSLKQFLDVYRIEFALKYRTVGNIKKSNEYLIEVNKKSISKTTKLLFLLPPKVLQLLLKVKHLARKSGFNFSVYN